MSAYLEKLKAKRKTKVMVPVPEWELDVWLHKTKARKRLDLVEMYEAIPRDAEGNIETADAIEFTVEVLASSIRDEGGVLQFDSDEGREFLSGEDFELLMRLTDEVLRLHKIAVKTPVDESGVESDNGAEKKTSGSTGPVVCLPPLPGAEVSTP